jgi:hypothetical protein
VQAHPAQAGLAPGAQHPSVQSGPVSPWARPGYLPPVEPVPALPQPDPARPAGSVPPGAYAPPPPVVGGGPVPGAPGAVPGLAPAHGGVAVARPPREALWKPTRVEPVAGTEFGVVHLEIAPVTSGLAVGSLIAGIAAVVVSMIVLCLGVAGASSGWGAWVAGAFTVLGLVAGGGGVGLGLTALRQIRRSGRPGLIRFTGRGPALGGLWCGAAGAGICVLSLALVLLVQIA